LSSLAKLNLKTVQRVVQKDPVIARREKLLAAIAEQKLVLDAMTRGETYISKVRRWRDDGNGEKALVELPKKVRPWFFQQDNGWYVQCRYGARRLMLDAKSNAVLVTKREEVATALTAIEAAVKAGELDEAIAAVSKRQKA
jgi:hypothetical protein